MSVPRIPERHQREKALDSSQSKAYSCKERPRSGAENICRSHRHSWRLPGFKGPCASSTRTTFKENSPFIFPGRGNQDLPPRWLSLKISREACLDGAYRVSGGKQRLKYPNRTVEFLLFWSEKFKVLFCFPPGKWTVSTRKSLLLFLALNCLRAIQGVTCTLRQPLILTARGQEHNIKRTHSTFLQKYKVKSLLTGAFLNACADERMQSADGWKTVPRTHGQVSNTYCLLLPSRKTKMRRHLEKNKKTKGLTHKADSSDEFSLTLLSQTEHLKTSSGPPV